MIALLIAVSLQASASAEAESPALTAEDACVELQGAGAGLIKGRRLRDRALARALVERIPAGRPVFVMFANERAQSDVQGMAAVSAAAHVTNAPQIVIVKTCDVAIGGNSQ